MGLDISALFKPPFVDKNDDECPFSSIFPFVAVSKLIVEGGRRFCSLGVGSSSDISE